MGVPNPGEKFNFNRVGQNELKSFDTMFLDLFEPYNVKSAIFRTQTASTLASATQTREATSSARTISRMLKGSST